MKKIFILALLLIICLDCSAQNKELLLESDKKIFQQTIDKFPILYTTEDWKFINQKAESKLESRDYSHALDLSTKSNILAEKLKDDLLAGRSFHQLGKIYAKLNNPAKAEENFHLSALSFSKILQTDKLSTNVLEFGYLLNDWAFIYSNPEFINSSDDIKKGLAILYQSYLLATSDKLPKYNIDKNEIIKYRIDTFAKIGSCFGLKGDFSAQIIWLERAQNEIPTNITPSLKTQYSSNLFDVFYGLQSAYQTIGAYERSFYYLRKLEVLLQSYQSSQKNLLYLRHSVDFYTDIANNRKRDFTIDLGINLSKKDRDENQLGSFYSAKLLTLLEENNFQEAKKVIPLLEDLSSKFKYSVNNLDILVGKAVIAGFENDRTGSDQYFQAAEKALQDQGYDWKNTLFLLSWESKIALHEKNYAWLKAINNRYLETVLDNNSKNSLPNVYLNLAKANEGLGNFAQAKEFNQKAIDFIETKRQSNSAQISTGVMESLYEAYQQSITYSLKENKIDEAFSNSELLKSRWLADKISNNPLSQKAIINDKLKEQIFNVSLEVIQNPNDDSFSQKLSKLEQNAIFYENQSNNKLSYEKSNVLTDLDKSPLNSETALISYVFTSDDKLTAFVWQKGKPFRIVPLDLSLPECDKIAQETAGKLKDSVFFKQDGQRIFDKLLKPLNLSDDTKQLIIVPDKSLWRIPFQALSAEGKTYLIENKIVSYAPSVSVLLDQINNPKPERKTFEVFSNSLFGNLYLKYADPEAKDLATLFSTKPNLNASVSDFTTRAGKSDIVHFSMHAQVETDEPFNSFLAFKPTSGNDGKLTVEDILKLKLKKQSMVFLASCDTNNVLNSEGLVSLAWGMLASGAGTVVSAQWEANDQATSVFTHAFYKNLQAGLSTADALQKTSIQMINDTSGNLSDPYNWAAFTLNGDYR